MSWKSESRGGEEGSTTGSFERAKPPRLNRSQSSRTRLGGAETGVDSDRQWGWYRGIASWHALCGPPNDARLLSPTVRFVGSERPCDLSN